MKKKNALSMTLAAAVLAAALAGCGQSGGAPAVSGTQDTDADPAGGEAAGGQQIVIWSGMMDNEVELLQKYADQWAEQTGNTVQVIKQDADIQQFSQAVNSADGPDGMFGIPNDQLANFVSANLVQEVPADAYDDADFAPAAIQASYIGGKRCAVPLAVETPILFYNTEKISEVPATWEDMIEAAKDNGGITFEATSVYYDLGMLRAFGGYIFNYADNAYDTADIGLGNEGAVKAYDFVNKLSNEYGFFASDITYDLAKSTFQNGDAAFYLGGAWDVAGFTEAGTPFAVTDVPTLNGQDFVTPVGTYVGFVSVKSDSQAAVFDLYNYFIENASEELYTVGSRIPALLSAQEKVSADSEATAAQIAQIAKGEPLPTVPEMGLLWQPFSDNIKLMLSGSITPEETAQYIDAQFKEAIEMMQSGQ